MDYVYLLESLLAPRHRYVGVTEDLKARLAIHNSGGSPAPRPAAHGGW